MKQKDVERLAPFVQPNQVEAYMEWLKNNPSIILTSNNDTLHNGITFTCGKCNSSEKVSGEELNNPCCTTEWECPICTGDNDPRRLGRSHTLMIRLN